MKVALIYFSATGNTLKIADVIERQLNELNVEVIKFDITSYSDRKKKIDLGPYQALVFGFPVHSWRAPRVVREWLEALDGKGKNCSMFFTYGGPNIGVSHYSTKQILEKQNFQVVSSAEFLGIHSFNLGGWKFLENRPDQSDFDVAREYALKIYRKFTGEDSEVVNFEKPKVIDRMLDAIEKYRFTVVTQLPSREGRECSMCRTCENLCPTNAMNADTGTADKDKCIVCFRCIANCPDDVLKVNDISSAYTKKVKREKLTEEVLNNRMSKIFF